MGTETKFIPTSSNLFLASIEEIPFSDSRKCEFIEDIGI
jgi:hypothetical protein